MKTEEIKKIKVISDVLLKYNLYDELLPFLKIHKKLKSNIGDILAPLLEADGKLEFDLIYSLTQSYDRIRKNPTYNKQSDLHNFRKALFEVCCIDLLKKIRICFLEQNAENIFDTAVKSTPVVKFDVFREKYPFVDVASVFKPISSFISNVRVVNNKKNISALNKKFEDCLYSIEELFSSIDKTITHKNRYTFQVVLLFSKRSEEMINKILDNLRKKIFPFIDKDKPAILNKGGEGRAGTNLLITLKNHLLESEGINEKNIWSALYDFLSIFDLLESSIFFKNSSQINEKDIEKRLEKFI